MTLKDVKRFYSKTEFMPSGCLRWKGALRRKNHYGQFWVNNTNVTSHRWIYEVMNGIPLKESELVFHTCDNKECVNIFHLYKGTHADNMRDVRERENCPKKFGEANSQAKLTESQVKLIQESQPVWSELVIYAKEWNVSVSHLYAVRRGVWRKYK